MEMLEGDTKLDKALSMLMLFILAAALAFIGYMSITGPQKLMGRTQAQAMAELCIEQKRHPAWMCEDIRQYVISEDVAVKLLTTDIGKEEKL